MPEAPGLSTVLLRALMANRHGFTNYIEPQDLLLVPPIPADMGFLDWNRHSEVMIDAYFWGKDELKRVRETGHPALKV